jgi:hypothetical protein
VYCSDETWAKSAHKSGRKMDDGSGGPKIPIFNGSRIIICHTGSADGGFVPAGK